uniref:Uncharacterized protein n=1 Tax=Cyclopterus lumpus TaxID=8103 RepID=A0A8C3AWG2_CYCLU
MEASGLVGVCLSPESTVTSLLSSSGHLRSSLLGPDHNTTFRYRHKVRSAPATRLCPLSSVVFTCFLVFLVLKERLTDRELDFLNLPVSSLHHRSNRDRLSMTTDELLSIPYDGSMPVTHTSAFIQGMHEKPSPLPSPAIKTAFAVCSLLSDNRIESLIQKADQVLNSLSLSSGEVDGPTHSPTFCFPQAWVSSLPENNLFKQPGPVEALKQMLFRLQAVEAELQRRQPASGAPTLLAGLQTVEAPVCELTSVSLLRAMHHLSRLKVLVEEPREKRVEEKERDEDEGRYSSSSADGLICTPQKPS